MITSVYIKNFKSIRETTINLPEYGVIVGKNAAGKSNFIQSLKFIRDLIQGRNIKAIIRDVALVPVEIFNFSEHSNTISFKICLKDLKQQEYRYSFSLVVEENIPDYNFNIPEEKLEKKISNDFKKVFHRKGNTLKDSEDNNIPLEVDAGKLAVALYKNVDANELRQLFKNVIIHDLDTEDFRESIANQSHPGLAGLLIRLKEKNGKLYDSFQRTISNLIPQFSSITDDALQPTKEEEKLHLVLLQEKDLEQKLSMKLISDGDLRTLFLIASAINLEEGSTLIVEEIENGLHPQRLKGLLDNLSSIASHKNTQVIFTTHSPLAINSQRPSDVILVQKTPEKGTVFVSMAENKDIVKIEEFLKSGGEMAEYININS